ncbi:hypothetical protein TREMEDRAFT_62461 [Tremella mesenterica DSM 1558]|uniref:uncharacterized protein n=1 Tax=Tremella mesenterica (strain ATCC 24925 / CBS 8224 / DSM 1558 / NBRC 9311 / NRRL Y-6157 / RJB 2259-6 / UBC 559-6) TaxID=578456 RepID=UPI0003F4A460|nr:uncharacterized protein TREMEDRAFT_62461 [Tremella mesenterica DSM 1558]EIW69601.1 hypothetical protein TREMEDRAFT_62461 [Tremella mesenterica DSM 1558]
MIRFEGTRQAVSDPAQRVGMVSGKDENRFQRQGEMVEKDDTCYPRPYGVHFPIPLRSLRFPWRRSLTLTPAWNRVSEPTNFTPRPTILRLAARKGFVASLGTDLVM